MIITIVLKAHETLILGRNIEFSLFGHGKSPCLASYGREISLWDKEDPDTTVRASESWMANLESPHATVFSLWGRSGGKAGCSDADLAARMAALLTSAAMIPTVKTAAACSTSGSTLIPRAPCENEV